MVKENKIHPVRCHHVYVLQLEKDREKKDGSIFLTWVPPGKL